MGKPISYRGTEYASVAAMPPEVRADYEADQEEFAEAATEAGLDELGGETTLAPAWGGPRRDGSVPVPKEFDAVTGLGPALEVHEAEQGIQFLPQWGTPVAHMAVRYQDGLAYQAKGKAIYTLRWEEVAAIVTNNRYHHGDNGEYTQCEYTLVKPSGEKLILDDWLKRVARLAAYIQQPVYERLWPPLADAYSAGQPLTFGPVTVARTGGLTLSGTTYAWTDIRNVQVEYGRLTVTLRDGKKHEVRVSMLPNVELLGRLIGVKFNSGNLAYQ